MGNNKSTYNQNIRSICRSGDLDQINELLTKRYPDWRWMSSGVCEGGHMVAIQLLIDRGGENFDWSWGLQGACVGGHMEIVQLALDSGATNFSLGLDTAFKGGNLKIIELMISLIDKDYIDYSSGFYFACEGGHIPAIQLIISLIDQTNETDDEMEQIDWNYGLRGACKGGQIPAIEFLIEHGADDYNSGFHGGCMSGHLPVIQMMIALLKQNGRKVKRKFLHRGFIDACRNGHTETVRFLIGLGADWWDEAISESISHHPDIGKLLQDHKENPLIKAAR
jgi:ankyrin repeat protein